MNGNTLAPVMMNVQQAARMLEAEWSGGNPFFNAVSADSRTLHAGSLFVALSGECFDGHRFIPDAINKGAVAPLVMQTGQGGVEGSIKVHGSVSCVGPVRGRSLYVAV